MSKTGIVRDDFYKKHINGYSHPECPERLEVIYEMLDQPEMNALFKKIFPREATEEEITAVHDPSYYRKVSETALRRGITPLDADTSAGPDSFRAAKLAAGGFLSLLEIIQNGLLGNGFALVRPPGHHAEANRAMGFCIFNNVAIGALYLIKKFSLNKVLIVDWDLHHGNGTQHSFYDNSQILYFSTHQYPFYPGTGDFGDVGKGKGKGFTINVPLQRGAGDEEYSTIFREILIPIAREFSPDFILVSAGFDIHFDDPLGGMRVTPEGFAFLTRMLMDCAQQICNGKLAMALEGGYGLMGLRDSVQTVLLELSGKTQSKIVHSKSSEEINPVINRVKKVQQEFWRCFS
ncbi:MAG: histone deacetylase [Thermodesulfobacteriota bacterium]|jgi:acetoin utilization deacetylase AcuC-like enzyme|nr:MAG: histone deacetylase [Thermodesulfobacteriota bacterium]